MYDVKVKHNFFTWGGLSWAELDAYRVIQQIWTISEHQCMDSPCRDSANVQYVQYLNKRQATLWVLLTIPTLFAYFLFHPHIFSHYSFLVRIYCHQFTVATVYVLYTCTCLGHSLWAVWVHFCNYIVSVLCLHHYTIKGTRFSPKMGCVFTICVHIWRSLWSFAEDSIYVLAPLHHGSSKGN